MSADSLMSHTGHNTGNLAFIQAGRMMFSADTDIRLFGDLTVKERKELDCLVIPAANFLGSHSNLRSMVDVLDNTTCPCLIFGLGAQSDRIDVVPDMQPKTVEFLKKIAARTSTVFLRGPYSQWVCSKLGVDNTVVTGCPSVFLNTDRTLGAQIQTGLEAGDFSRPVVHGSCRKGNLKSVETELVRLCQRSPGSLYVVQRPVEVLRKIYRETLSNADLTYLNGFAKFLNFDSYQAYANFLEVHGYAPVSVDSWQAMLRRFSISVNTRIHGTMLGLSAGIPSICVTHDTRTEELSEVLKVPRVTVQDYIETRYNLRETVERAQFDGESFEQNRSELARAYVNAIEGVDLDVAPVIKSF